MVSSGCFLFGVKTQQNPETGPCEEEVHSEFSVPETVDLLTQTQKIKNTLPFFYLPLASYPISHGPSRFPKKHIPPPKNSRRNQRHNHSLKGMELPLS